ncbi:MAG TPA: hypothetical protein PLO50_13460, partial [Nitrospira sp.]|nr:hypothetical protein [Nitrospira sp.]
NCWPVGTRKFEFAALQLPIDTDHNVMVTRGDFVKGASGSPVWFERRRPLLVKGGAVPRGPVMRVQHQLLGIVEGAFEFPLSTLVTYTTLITPKVLGRLKHPAFLSAL